RSPRAAAAARGNLVFVEPAAPGPETAGGRRRAAPRRRSSGDSVSPAWVHVLSVYPPCDSLARRRRADTPSLLARRSAGVVDSLRPALSPLDGHHSGGRAMGRPAACCLR